MSLGAPSNHGNATHRNSGPPGSNPGSGTHRTPANATESASARGHSRTNRRRIAEIKVGPSMLMVDSDCGVVKLVSRAGHVWAMNPTEARRVAGELAQALTTAAYSVERAREGGPR